MVSLFFFFGEGGRSIDFPLKFFGEKREEKREQIGVPFFGGKEGGREGADLFFEGRYRVIQCSCDLEGTDFFEGDTG